MIRWLGIVCEGWVVVNGGFMKVYYIDLVISFSGELV